MFYALAVVLGLTAFVASIIIVVAAFRTSAAQGLLTLFVPFYIFYFVFAKYVSPRKGLLFGLWIGGLLASVGVGLQAVASSARTLGAALSQELAKADLTVVPPDKLELTTLGGPVALRAPAGGQAAGPMEPVPEEPLAPIPAAETPTGDGMALRAIDSLRVRVEVPAGAKVFDLTSTRKFPSVRIVSLQPDCAVEVSPVDANPLSYDFLLKTVSAEVPGSTIDVLRNDKSEDGAFRIEYVRTAGADFGGGKSYGVQSRVLANGKKYDCAGRGDSADASACIARACESIQGM